MIRELLNLNLYFNTINYIALEIEFKEIIDDNHNECMS